MEKYLSKGLQVNEVKWNETNLVPLWEIDSYLRYQVIVLAGNYHLAIPYTVYVTPCNAV